MRESILGPPEQRQGITCIKAHSLPPASKRYMQGAIGIRCQLPHIVRDEIGGALIFLCTADVLQGLSIAPSKNMNVLLLKVDSRQTVVAAEPMEPSRRL